jgi:hypothetical protein
MTFGEAFFGIPCYCTNQVEDYQLDFMGGKTASS